MISIIDILNDIDKKDNELYIKITNLQILTYNLSKLLKCNKEDIQLIYDVSSWFYLNNYTYPKTVNKVINVIQNNKNPQNISYIDHKIHLIISVCNYYNLLREQYNHEESISFIDKYEFYPPIIKKTFINMFDKDLFNTLDYSYYDLNYEED